jgi:hypothetical protein
LIETLNDKAREVELLASFGFAVPKTLAPVPTSAAELVEAGPPAPPGSCERRGHAL